MIRLMQTIIYVKVLNECSFLSKEEFDNFSLLCKEINEYIYENDDVDDNSAIAKINQLQLKIAKMAKDFKNRLTEENKNTIKEFVSNAKDQKLKEEKDKALGGVEVSKTPSKIDSKICKEKIIDWCRLNLEKIKKEFSFDSSDEEKEFSEVLVPELFKTKNWKRMSKEKIENGVIERSFNCEPFDDQLRGYVIETGGVITSIYVQGE